ncbi:MAG: hypothetical protein AAGK92_10465 [Pseudomonadota bacterium]
MLTIIADAMMVASRQKRDPHDVLDHDQHAQHQSLRKAREGHQQLLRLNSQRFLW